VVALVLIAAKTSVARGLRSALTLTHTTECYLHHPLGVLLNLEHVSSAAWHASNSVIDQRSAPAGVSDVNGQLKLPVGGHEDCP
jgi:hypothetical protein